MGFIYSILNKKRNKSYIGLCLDFKIRKRGHINRLDSQSHCNRYLQNSWNKYGAENFEFIVLLDNIPKEKLCEYEVKMIKLFQTNNHKYGYNLTSGGEGVRDYKHTKEFIESRKVPRPELSGEKHPFYNKKHTKESKKIISEYMSGEGNGMYGKCHSEEAKKIIGEKSKIAYQKRREKADKDALNLDKRDVELIKQMLSDGFKQKDIALKFNTYPLVISCIKNNK